MFVCIFADFEAFRFCVVSSVAIFLLVAKFVLGESVGREASFWGQLIPQSRMAGTSYNRMQGWESELEWGVGWRRRNKTIKRHRKGINFPKECRIFMIWSSHPFEKWRSFFIMYFHRRLLQPEAPSSRGDPRSNLEVLCHEAI
jgi:hypothetical protein